MCNLFLRYNLSPAQSLHLQRHHIGVIDFGVEAETEEMIGWVYGLHFATPKTRLGS